MLNIRFFLFLLFFFLKVKRNALLVFDNTLSVPFLLFLYFAFIFVFKFYKEKFFLRKTIKFVDNYHILQVSTVNAVILILVKADPVRTEHQRVLFLAEGSFTSIDLASPLGIFKLHFFLSGTEIWHLLLPLFYHLQ